MDLFKKIITKLIKFNKFDKSINNFRILILYKVSSDKNLNSFFFIFCSIEILCLISLCNEMRFYKMNKLLSIFKALSDKNRIRILLMLSKKKLCVCEIQDILGVTVSTVSKHLSILRDIGFIVDEKEGKWVNYRLNTASKDIVLNQLILILPFYLNDDELIQSDMEKVNTVCRKDLCNV